jgi:hypothetical protein
MDIILTITMTPNGIQVGGPINDKILCLGLLALATQSVLNYDPTAIQIASPIVGTHS